LRMDYYPDWQNKEQKEQKKKKFFFIENGF
jgi:hypothetical protein